MLMVTIVNQRHKHSCDELVRPWPSTFIKTSYWKLKIWVLQLSAKVMHQTMSHISLTNLTCDASWIRCMWAADNTTGSFSQVYSSALQLFQLFHPPFHTVDLLLLSLWKIICNNMIWDTDNKDWCDATEFLLFGAAAGVLLGHQSVDRPSLHHLGS